LRGEVLAGEGVAFLSAQFPQDLLGRDRLLQVLLGDWISLSGANVVCSGRPLAD
jgi:hypothetical protein